MLLHNYLSLKGDIEGLPFQLSIPGEKSSSSLWVNYVQDMDEEKTFWEAPRVNSKQLIPNSEIIKIISLATKNTEINLNTILTNLYGCLVAICQFLDDILHR